MKSTDTGAEIENEVTRLSTYGCLIFILCVVIGFGCCGYYTANQPKAVDWNMRGEETKWEGMQPYETEKRASDIWMFVGVMLVVLSPLWTIIGTPILMLLHQRLSKNSQEK